MITKVRLKDVHSRTPIHSGKGEGYMAESRDGLQVMTASRPFSLTARHFELRDAGCRSFIIDLSDADRNSWSDIISAFRGSRPIDGTTEFNYTLGLA